MTDDPNFVPTPLVPEIKEAKENKEIAVKRKPNPTEPSYIISVQKDFQYAEHTRRLYLYTRKPKFDLANVTFPGLFSEPGYSDTYWLILALIIELVTTITIAQVFNIIFRSYITAISVASMLVVVDLVFAFLNHWLLTRDYCLRENQKLLVTPSMRSGGARNEKRYKDFFDIVEGYQLKATKLSFWSIIFWLTAIVMVLLGILKVLTLSANISHLGDALSTQDDTDSSSGLAAFLSDARAQYGMIVAFTVLYGVVVYIHLAHTGWSLFGSILTFWQKRDAAARQNPRTATEYRRVAEKTEIDLKRFIDELRASGSPTYLEHVPEDIDRALEEGLKVCPTEAVVEGIEEGLWVRYKEGDADAAERVHEICYTEEEATGFYPHYITRKEGEKYVYVFTRMGVLMDKELKALANAQNTKFATFTVALWGHAAQLHSISALNVHHEDAGH